MERTLLDIHVMYPSSQSYIKRSRRFIYNTKERRKGAYVETVTWDQKGSFTPFLMSRSGRMGTGAVVFIKRVAGGFPGPIISDIRDYYIDN